MRRTASWKVPMTLVLAALLKPMWLSLIWTKFNSAVARAAGLARASPNAREERMPPEIEQTTAVPAHPMHLRKPRRSMPSWAVSFTMRFLSFIGIRPVF
jgi:hypothetical protein